MQISNKKSSNRKSKVKQHRKEIELAYEFFLVCEEQGTLIGVTDIEDATTYAPSTVNTYISKKWWWFLAETTGNKYSVKGLKGHTLEEFIDLHRQKRGPASKGLSSQFVLYLSSPLLKWLSRQAYIKEHTSQTLISEAIKNYCEANGFNDPIPTTFHIQTYPTKRVSKKSRVNISSLQQMILIDKDAID